MNFELELDNDDMESSKRRSIFIYNSFLHMQYPLGTFISCEVAVTSFALRCNSLIWGIWVCGAPKGMVSSAVLVRSVCISHSSIRSRDS